MLYNFQIRVEISVTFLKIGEIDTLKEQFEADILVKSRWREPALDDQHVTELSSYWNPKIYIENAIGEPSEEFYLSVEYNECMEAYLSEKKKVKGVFLENLELKDFPFDVQVGISILKECVSFFVPSVL